MNRIITKNLQRERLSFFLLQTSYSIISPTLDLSGHLQLFNILIRSCKKALWIFLGLILGLTKSFSQEIISISPPKAVQHQDSTQRIHTQFKLPATPHLKSIKLTGQIQFRPEDINNGNIVSPNVSGSYEDYINKNFLLNFYLTIQAPPSSNDTLKLVNRMLESGGVGSLSFGPRWITFNGDTSRGITASGSFSFKWNSANIVNNGVTSSKFSFISYNVTLSGWFDFFIASYSVTWQPMHNPSNFIEQQVGSGKPIHVVSGAFLFDENYFCQFKYLIPSHEIGSSQENFDIRLGYKLDIDL